MPPQLAVEMTGDEARLWASMQKVVRGQGQIDRGFDQIQHKGQRAGRQVEKAFSGRAISNLRNYALGLTSVSTLIGGLTNKYRTGLQNIREFSAEARKAGDELVALAALQEGGKKAERVQAAADLAARYGIRDRGQAFGTVQGLQSIYGSWDKGFKAAETVFAATQVGIPLEKGVELEILAVSQKQKVGDAIRRAFVAGEASGRTPAALARAAPALTFWDDKELGFAAAGLLSGAVREEQLETYVKAGGIGLAETSTLAKTFRRLKVRGADRLTKMRALAEAGLDTPDKLKAAGLSEIRQQQAVAALVANVAEVERILSEIRTKAVPGVLARERREIEAEIPGATIDRELKRLEVRAADQKAFGPRALEARGVERTERIRAIALRNLGYEEGAFGVDYIDEAERSSWFAGIRWGFHAALRNLTGRPQVRHLTTEMERIERELTETDPLRQDARQDEMLEESRRTRRAVEDLVGLQRERAPSLAPVE